MFCQLFHSAKRLFHYCCFTKLRIEDINIRIEPQKTRKDYKRNSSQCFPIYIYYGFVVEADCSISNVMICPTLMFCDYNENIDLIEQEYIKKFTAEVIRIKTNT